MVACLVTPFAWHFRVLDQIGYTLNAIDRDCTLSISLRPTVLYPTEEAVLIQLLKAAQWLAQNLPYDNEQAQQAADLYTRQLQRPNGLLTMRVHLAGPEPIPAGLSLAVASALSHAEQEAKDISANPRCVVVSARPEQLNIARNNLVCLEQNEWQRCAILPALQRLPYLVDTKGALAIFRLPVPSSQEILGVGIGRSAMRSSRAQLALPVAVG